MNKSRSRQPANAARPARRSLVELTAAATRSADDGAPMTPVGPTMPAADRSPRLESAPETLARPEGRSSESAAEMMVKIAKDYQNSVLDNIRNSLNAALDQAKDFAETKPGREQEGDSGRENKLLAATAAYRAEALDLMQANVASTLNFACEMAGAKTAAEFVKLSGAQARKNCELMLKQAEAMKSLAHAVTKERDGRG
jgi:hypothetical protein